MAMCLKKKQVDVLSLDTCWSYISVFIHIEIEKLFSVYFDTLFFGASFRIKKNLILPLCKSGLNDFILRVVDAEIICYIIQFKLKIGQR